MVDTISITLRIYPLALLYSKDIAQYVEESLEPGYELVHPHHQGDPLISPPSIILIHLLELFPLLQQAHYKSLFSPASFIILISGEPNDIPPALANLTIVPYLNQPSLSIYFPFLYSSLSERRQFDFPVIKKTKFCAFMYSQNHAHRNNWFHKLHAHQHVDALGTVLNNIAIPSTRLVNNGNETYNDIAVRLYSSYFFVLAIENTWKEGYMTEKLINPIMAHSIPLYWGHPDAFKYINKKRVIYLPDYTDDNKLFRLLKHLQSSHGHGYDQYQSIIKQPWYSKKGNPSTVFSNVEKSLKSHLQKALYN